MLTGRSGSEAETYGGKGDAENPYDPQDLTHKYHELDDTIWARELAGAVCANLLGIEEVDDISQLTARCARRSERVGRTIQLSMA